MSTDDRTARDLVDRAEHMESTARRSAAYLTTYFRAWGIASVAMGIALMFFPLVGSLWYLATCFAVWVGFTVWLCVFYYRGRATRPKRSSAMTVGIVGGSVPWSLAMVVIPRLAGDPWWIRGAPYLVAGVVCCGCLLVAASMAQRDAR